MSRLREWTIVTDSIDIWVTCHQFLCQACVVVLLAWAVFAEEIPEEKKVDKRGLLGLRYGYGQSLAYVPAVVSTPALSYTKASSQQDATKTNRTACTPSDMRLPQRYEELLRRVVW
jgi:hypothetical protein